MNLRCELRTARTNLRLSVGIYLTTCVCVGGGGLEGSGKTGGRIEPDLRRMGNPLFQQLLGHSRISFPYLPFLIFCVSSYQTSIPF